LKSRILSAVLILLFITACNGTFEVGIEHSPASTAGLAATSMTAPDTLVPPVPTNSPLSPTAQALIETPVPTDLPTQHTVQIFLIAVNDNGQTGILVGCGDSAVPVQIETPPTQGVLKAALVALLSVKDQFYGQSGLYNALYQSDLQVETVSIDSGKASVYLTGTLIMGGECDAPRVQAQLEQTVLQFPTVTEAAIFINGKPLADVLSLKG
jgi:Sporulation and spore germination